MRRRNDRSIRVGRLVGVFAVVGALLAGPLMVTGSAATPLQSYAGRGTGYALRVVVDLSGMPAAAKTAIQSAYDASHLASNSGGKLPSVFPFVIDQRFIETLSNLGTANHGHAELVSGLLSSVANSVDVTRMGTSDTSNSASSKQLPGVTLPILTASAGLLNAAIVSVPRVTSDGSLASVQASLKSLLDSGLLPAPVQAVFTQIQDAVDAAVVSANGALDAALGQVASTYATAASATDPVLGPVLGQAGLTNVVKNATNLKAAVPAIPQMDDLLGAVAANVKALDNKGLAEQSRSKAFADASSKLGSIDVLGLVHVGLSTLTSHSEAAGTRGSARNTSTCSLSTARLGASGVSLDGKSLLVNGLLVPVPAVNIPAVKSAVDQVVGAAGLSVGLCDAATGAVAAQDGSKASQTVSALRITFAPALTALPQSNPLGFVLGSSPVKLIIDPSVSTAASARVSPAVAAAPAANLPRTGPGPMPMIIGGIVAAGAVIFLLRRRLGLVNDRSS